MQPLAETAVTEPALSIPLPPLPPPEGGGGVLRLVATPLGNMADITLRALSALASADVVACEDTRVTRKLFTKYGLPAPRRFVSCHGHNETAAVTGVLERLAAGEAVAYCSDAGTPGVSDPGVRLAAGARAAGFPVEVVPGASAAVAGLLASGLSTATFTFLGFPPRKPGRLLKFFGVERKRRHTLIVYEAPRRLGRVLAAAAEALGGGRRAAVCLELTKKHERIRSGTLLELADHFARVTERGEATVVIAGAETNSEKEKDREQDRETEKGIGS